MKKKFEENFEKGMHLEKEIVKQPKMKEISLTETTIEFGNTMYELGQSVQGGEMEKELSIKSSEDLLLRFKRSCLNERHLLVSGVMQVGVLTTSPF